MISTEKGDEPPHSQMKITAVPKRGDEPTAMCTRGDPPLEADEESPHSDAGEERHRVGLQPPRLADGRNINGERKTLWRNQTKQRRLRRQQEQQR